MCHVLYERQSRKLGNYYKYDWQYSIVMKLQHQQRNFNNFTMEHYSFTLCCVLIEII